MTELQNKVEQILQIWQFHFGKLTKNEIKSFRMTKDVRALCKYDVELIKKAINTGGRFYIKDILKYVEENSYRLQKSKNLPLCVVYSQREKGSFEPVLVTKACGHRYECTCHDAYTLFNLRKVAA